MKWTAIIEKNAIQTHTTIDRKLDEIAAILLDTGNLEPLIQLPGLTDSRMGIVLFLFYYATLTKNQDYMNHAFDMLSGILDQAADMDFQSSRFMFTSGLPGMGWAIEHLAQQGFIDADTNDILGDLDGELFEAMRLNLERGHYDYTSGALGIALYFLSRKTLPQSGLYLTELVNDLEKISQPDQQGGLKWESVKNYKTGEKGFGISLSHGMSSIISILAKMIAAKILDRETEQKAGRLVDGAMTYLLNQRLDGSEGNYFSCFPRWALEHLPVTSSRLAWCYGDLGIATAIKQAAQAMNRKDWGHMALEVFHYAARRRDLEQNRVIDAGVCHGAVGISHIFNRVYQETGTEEFKIAALYWLEQTLNMAGFEDGYAGYKVKYADEFGGLVNKAGLLEGIAGIGLVLISMVSDMEPKWDGLLLLS